MSDANKTCVVVAWHREEQIRQFLNFWGLIDMPLTATHEFVILQQDKEHEGCARTKNRGIAEAVRRGFEIVIVLDDDCFPERGLFEKTCLTDFMAEHVAALSPQPVLMAHPVSNPPSRGTPYFERDIIMPVAASMGFWKGVGDYDAPGQLVYGAKHPMQFVQRALWGSYFALSGMNIAFRPADWLPWCTFIDVPRFDDIWMGWLWQREAYRRGYCFNLNGPIVRHARQSNVWQNLRDEAKYLERNETLWRDIATHEKGDYESLRKLLPV